MGFVLKFWGVRGSLPASLPPAVMKSHLLKLFQEFWRGSFPKHLEGFESFLKSQPVAAVLGYGGETSCVEVRGEQTRLIVDAGSGLRLYGESLKKQNLDLREHHLLLTHFHWDHLLGLPFFWPCFQEGHIIHIYSVDPQLKDRIRVKFTKPFFPVPFEVVEKQMEFHILKPRHKVDIGEFEVTPYQLDHPDPCWGYRIEKQGVAYAHCVDTEGQRMSPADLGPDLPLYQDVLLMYFDAQYTLPELVEKANWGHSAAQIGLDIAMREKIPYVVFGHHDPGASISYLQNLERQVTSFMNWKRQNMENNRMDIFEVRWRFAFDGLKLDLLALKEAVRSLEGDSEDEKW